MAMERRKADQGAREQRNVPLTDLEVRTDASGDAIGVRGHAIVWDKPAWIGPPKFGFSERFAKGSTVQTVSGGADVRYLFNHNPDAVLARTKSGTLRLAEDTKGLAVDADLAPTSVGRDLAILFERRVVDQMSVGFQVVKDEWEEIEGADGNVYEQRTIHEVKLFDVSAVTYPAYEETDAGLRDAQLARELRDARGAQVKRIPTLNEVREAEQEPATATPPEPPTAPPNQGGESPEDPPGPEPATATPPQPEGEQVDERSMPLTDRLLAHASGKHRAAPRALCPACSSTAPATATPA